MAAQLHAGITPPMPVVSLRVVIRSEQFGNETVVVVLEWTVENGAFNRLNVVPQAETVDSLGPSSRQLMLSYNTSYNISAVASLCGQYSSHSIELHYGELLNVLAKLLVFSVQCHVLNTIQLNAFLHSVC